ncbi:hypothetical protein [Blastopirellula marina]|nr:hypothetical protein [Blastopirellula marina]
MPASPPKITQKEIFLLTAAAAQMLGATSYDVRSGLHDTLLF